MGGVRVQGKGRAPGGAAHLPTEGLGLTGQLVDIRQTDPQEGEGKPGGVAQPDLEPGGAAPLHRQDAGRELQGAGKNGRQAQGQGQNRKKDHQGKQERGEPALEKDLEQQGGSQGGGVSDTSVQHGGLT